MDMEKVDKNAKYRKKSRAKEKIKAEEAIAAGSCRYHSETAAKSGTTLCEYCLQMRKERKRRLKAQGFCPSHGKNKVLPGKKVCQKCLDDAKERATLRQKNGFCVNHPSIPLVRGKRYCDTCMDEVGWRRIKSKYDLTKEQYITECNARHFKCDICKISCLPAISNHKKNLVYQIDHCHKTGKFRGLLCHACNIFIGHMKEDIARLAAFNENVINYIKDFE